jgi:UDP:flavonoid glycosyltransferase YjiC (YdhE family)
MRVLFTLQPGTGSLHPLLPVARALARAGHEVAWCSAPSFRSEAEATGFPYFGAGVDWCASNPGCLDFLCAAGGVTFPGLTGETRSYWVMTSLFAGVCARRMAPDVVSIARNWRADLIIRESMEFGGCAAAEALGLPHASVAAAADSALDLSDVLAPAMADLRRELGLPTEIPTAMPYRYAHLCFSPPSFDGPSAQFPATAHFLRHTNPPRPGERVPDWIADLAPRPTVLVSLGTTFHRTPGVFETILDGLQDEPLNLILAVGRDRDPATFGPQPAHVRIERYVPQTLLLPHCTLFVTHGGFGSVKEALSLGVPMVVIPIAVDQPYSAERCVALGLAEVIGPRERTPERVRGAVRAALASPSYKRHAEQFQREMMALPGPERAVELLQSLARERRTVPVDTKDATRLPLGRSHTRQ